MTQRMPRAGAARYDRGMWCLERFSLLPLRAELLTGVAGEVLEIGVGTGANLPFYPAGVQMAAVDRQAERLAAAAGKTKRGPRPAFACADAQQLPFPDGAFDAVVGSLVFCSIPDPLAALADVRRVLRPGGRLHLLEHVRGQTPMSRRLTDWLHPVWFALQGECHLNRETAAAVEEAGFQIDQLSVHSKGLLQLIRATSPGAP